MEFKEFTNPEENNFDITMSFETLYTEEDFDKYSEEMIDLIGILENVSDEYLLNNYGITEFEYLHPTEKTINKVKEHLGIRTR